MNVEEMEKKVDEIMEGVDDAAVPDKMAPEEAIEFYDMLIERIQINRDALKEEHGYDMAPS